MQANERLSIAIQKKGRLSEESLNLLQRCGLKLLPSKSSLYYSAQNLPLDILLVRDDDIPNLLARGVCDVGILGENCLQESETQANTTPFRRIYNLGFAKCRLSIAIPKDETFNDITWLQNKTIATSYPALLKNFLNLHKLNANIVSISGSVEIAPQLKMADAICDLVSTGRTLEENNLKEEIIVLESEAVLIQQDKDLSEVKGETLSVLLRRMEGVQQAQESKYILFHAPKNALEEIRKLLPGKEMPTIMQLDDDSHKVAVHVVSREGVFWNTLENLRQAGASSILVMNIEKMMV